MKNGTQSGNFIHTVRLLHFSRSNFSHFQVQFFLKVTNFPKGPFIKKMVSKHPVEKCGKFEVSRGIQKNWILPRLVHMKKECDYKKYQGRTWEKGWKVCLTTSADHRSLHVQ